MKDYQVALLTPSPEEMSGYREYFLAAVFAPSGEAACSAAIAHAIEEKQYLGDELTEPLALHRFPRVTNPRC